MSLAFSLAPHLFRYRPYQQKSRLCRLLLGRSPLNSIERMSSMTSIDGGSVSNAVGITPRPFRTLYPRIQPFQTGHLEVSDIHSIYYEVSGNPSGLPVCFIHGGPGGGTVPAHRRFFDPQGNVCCRPVNSLQRLTAPY